MAKIVQTRRGTTEQHKGFDGQEGEVTVDLTENTLRVHDGSTFPVEQPSGYSLARSDMSNVVNSVGITQLNLSDGTAGQMIITDGNGTISFMSPSNITLSGDLTGTIDNAQIVPSAVGTLELADFSVTTEKLANDAVTNAKLADNSIQTENIINSGVTTDNIADLNVTRVKLQNDVVDNTKLADNSIQTENIVDLSVTTSKLANLSVTTEKIADGAITTSKIADGAVTNSKISTLDASKLTGSLSNVDGTNITGLPYDVSFLAGWDSETLPTDLLIQSYAEMVMGRTGIFDGEVGLMETAAVGSAVICDIELNGTSIYSTKPTFPDGSTTMTAGVLSTSGFSSGDKLSFKVIQIGPDPDFGKGIRFMMKCRV